MNPSYRQAYRLGCLLLISVLIAIFSFVSGNDPVFAKGGKDPKKAIQKNDKNHDGKISLEEWQKSEEMFNQIDLNQDGFISLEEMEARLSGSIDSPESGQPAKRVWYKDPGYWQGPFIDAHSQIDIRTDLDQLIVLINQAGVAQVILSTRFDQPSTDVIRLAKTYPDRIHPAAKTKTKSFMKGSHESSDEFYREILRFDFPAMAEIIMWHAEKKEVGAGKATMSPNDMRIKPMLDTARKKNWPVIAHIEFSGMGQEKTRYMKEFKIFLSENPDLDIGLIHMGQLTVEDAQGLLLEFKNLFFITSHCNPVTERTSKLPWTRMFNGEQISPAWKALLIRYPDRFVLAFDNVFHFQWENSFLPQVLAWRKALTDLPDPVAHALAHGNAERLWKLKPAILP